MKPITYALVLLAAAVTGLALGLGLRHTQSAVGSPLTLTNATSIAGSQARSTRSADPQTTTPKDDSPLATRLARDISMSSGVTRWLYWLEAIEQATAADFPRLYQLAKNNAAAKRLVGDRWVELYPRQLFDAIVAASKNGQGFSMRDLANQLFREWPKKDPDAAIAALSGPGESASIGGWRHSAAASVIEKDAERGLKLFYDWHLENFGPFMTGVAKWAAANPQHAAEFAMQYPSGYVTQLAMETIGQEWAKQDPARAMEFAGTKPGKPGMDLAHAALNQWSQNDLAGAANWLAGTDARGRDGLSVSFVEPWGKKDPASALAWCDDNLTGSSLARAVGSVVKGAAAKDVSAAADLVLSLNESPARAEAAEAVAKLWFPDLSTRETPPPEAVKWLSSLDNDSAQRALGSIAWSWAGSDPKGMAAFLGSSSEQYPSFTYDIVARELTHRNPMEALDWVKTLPEGRSLDVGSTAFGEWRRSQPEEATKWLAELPANDPRHQPYLESAIRSLAWDPITSAQLANLSDSERVTAAKVIEKMELSKDRRASLMAILEPH